MAIKFCTRASSFFYRTQDVEGFEMTRMPTVTTQIQSVKRHARQFDNHLIVKLFRTSSFSSY